MSFLLLQLITIPRRFVIPGLFPKCLIRRNMLAMKYAYYACSIVCSVICLMMYSAWVNAGATTQGLEQQVSPDERQRMHQDLDEYATKTYPERLV